MLPVAIDTYQFEASPARALYWPVSSSLLLADLHLGKADTFRQHGIAVPQSVQWGDLERLSALLVQYQPATCYVLGDLIHGRTLHAPTVQAWNALVMAHPHTRFELVEGNHDRTLQRHALQLHAVHSTLWLGDVCLSHEPLPIEILLAIKHRALNIHGHIHPAVKIAGSRSKLPALIYQPPYFMLPAFSEFTAGVVVQSHGQRIWVCVESEGLVIPLS
jgi:uncharacterized protein